MPCGRRPSVGPPRSPSLSPIYVACRSLRRVVESWLVDGSRGGGRWQSVVVVDGSRGGGCGRDVVRGCCVVAQRRGHAAWTCLLQMTHGCQEKILESEDGEHTRRVG